jgi:hypothetical protein
MVEEKGIIKHRSPGKYRLTRDLFYFKIKGINQIFGIYNRSQAYTYISKQISENDTLTVYFVPGYQSPNLDVFQIEKGSTVILEQKKKQEENLWGACFSLVGGLGLLGIVIYQDKKNWN